MLEVIVQQFGMHCYNPYVTAVGLLFFIDSISFFLISGLNISVSQKEQIDFPSLLIN